jgi:hypothetical protein
LKLNEDEPLSCFPFSFNLRRSTKAALTKLREAKHPNQDYQLVHTFVFNPKVRRCRMTVSKTLLKAPMVSALESII